MSRTCPMCDHPIADAGTACHDCQGKTATNLRSLADHWPQLTITLTRQDRIGDPAPSGAETPLMFSEKAHDVANIITNTLTTWARDIEEQRGSTAPSRTPTLARWLADQTTWLRHRDYGPEALDELDHCWHLLRTTIDRPPKRTYAGPCDHCRRDMYAAQGAPSVQCRDCGATYDVNARREWLLEQADHTLAHASLIARALDELGEPIKSDRIRQWASRGRLIPKATDHAGRALYAVHEVRALIRQEEERVRDSRRHTRTA